MGAMALYQNVSDPRVLEKTFYRKATFQQGEFKLLDSTNVSEPKIILSNKMKISGTGYRNYTNCNYVYLDDTARYYFVQKIELLNGGLVAFQCKVDVLQSYASYIKQLTAFVTRQEYSYSPYYVDGELPLKNTNIAERINFTTFFRTDLTAESNCFVLTVNGGN